MLGKPNKTELRKILPRHPQPNLPLLPTVKAQSVRPWVGPQTQVWVFIDQAKPILPSIIWGVKMECGNTLATISFLFPIIFNNVNAWFNLFPAL